MKFHHLAIALMLMLGLNSCWIGDQDDPGILYDETIIEILCQTPQLTEFCKMVYLTKPTSFNGQPSAAYELYIASAGITNGQACPRNVESVFAPSNTAIEEFLDDNPQWETIYDIPTDTMDLIVKHHIRLKWKMVNFDNLSDYDCTMQEIVGGARYPMWIGDWQFLTNAQGQFIAASVQGNVATTTPIITPDISSTDGVVYIIEDVLPPFLP